MNTSKIIFRQRNLQTHVITLVLAVITLYLFQIALVSAEQRTSYSISTKSKDKDVNFSATIYDQDPQSYPVLKTNLDEIQAAQNTNTVLAAPRSEIVVNSNISVHNYTITNATVHLLHDQDGDGHHHNFAVTFDADVDVDSSIVYARLYIGFAGGALSEYLTTDIFEINGNSRLDELYVETVLNEFYPTDIYDIQIELFEVGVLAPVAIYGPANNISLINIPLEDEESDFVAAGCSLNINAQFDPILVLLILFSLFYMFRRYKKII